MSDTGWISPGTMADSDAVGDLAWSNPDNAKVSDGSYATITSERTSPGQIYTHYLKASNFGLSIPAGSTIDQIDVRIEHKVDYNKESGTSAYDTFALYSVRFIKDDDSYVEETIASIPSIWSETSDTISDYSTSNIAHIDINDVNNSNFGVIFYNQVDIYVESGTITLTGYVDHIQIKVYYTESGVTSAPVAMFFRP